MSKTAISVTLAPENLLWLESQALVRKARSLSATLDAILAEARQGRQVRAARSVVGTVRIDESDPELNRADAAERALFGTSLRPRRARRPAGKRPRPGRA